MPDWLLTVYAKVIIDYAGTAYLTNANGVTRKAASLQHGSEKHLALLKSMGRKRWYDKNKFSYRAFNTLFLMEPLLRRELAIKINASCELVYRYQDKCKQTGTQPHEETLKKLLLLWLNASEQDAYHYLDELESLGALGGGSVASNRPRSSKR
jgi:hypothetical protein